MVIEVLSTNKNQLPACDRNMPNTFVSKGWVGMSFKKKNKTKKVYSPIYSSLNV